MHLDLSTMLLQWATGGLAFGWVTTRGRLVSLGYGWLLRVVFGLMAAAAVAAELADHHDGVGRTLFLVGGAGVVLGAALALGVSVARRRAGVGAARVARARAAARVAAMTGPVEPGPDDGAAAGAPGGRPGREFPPSSTSSPRRSAPSACSVRRPSPVARSGSPGCGSWSAPRSSAS